MFTAARLALPRSPAAAPRAASLGLGAGLRQVAEDPSFRRLLPGHFLPRLFASGAPAQGETPPKPNKDSPSDPEMEYKRRYEEKRRELIVLLTDALDTCEPAVRDRVSEKQRELQQMRQEYHAKTQVDARGATMSKAADGPKTYTVGEFASITASCIFLGLALGELEQKLFR